MVIQRKKWQRPQIPPKPLDVQDVSRPVLDLSGVWKFCREAPEKFWIDSIDTESWQDMQVPCDVSALGIAPAAGEYAYKRMVAVPSDFAGKRVLLRFEGANYKARVWVDGNPAGEHCGGFTSWDCNITCMVTAGQSFMLTVGICDMPGHLNPENKGGLIRPVLLIAFPMVYIGRLHMTTTADKDFKDFTLETVLDVNGSCTGKPQVELTLVSPRGERVKLLSQEMDTASQSGRKWAFTIDSPLKWDAEHPSLYTLEAQLFVDGCPVERIARNVGFRQIGITGNRMYVNGREIKLRGICRHDASPLCGRAVSIKLMEQDILLLKQANINCIRTTNYPPREEFLDFCDRYGMYVQEESPLAYVDTPRIPAEQNDPQYSDEIMIQFAEMIERDMSHPAVIIWGLGSESAWGINFRHEKEYARREDPTRPLVFNFPMSCQGEENPPEIWSVHYISHDMDMAKKYDHMIIGHTHGSDLPPGYEQGVARGYDRPVLHDEFAHIACYDRDEHKRDPGIRDFWGEGLKTFWDRIWSTPGALGGAIWSAVDDVTIHSGGGKDYEWGILDVWRREKPEYLHVKKAYSPVRVMERSISNPDRESIEVTVENRYCHTGMEELEILWRMGTGSGTIHGFALQPGCTGRLKVPVSAEKSGDSLMLTFVDPAGMVVEECAVIIDPLEPGLPEPGGAPPSIVENDREIHVNGTDFCVSFSKTTGLVTAGRWKENPLLKSGPCLNMAGMRLPEWAMDGMETTTRGSEAIIVIKGHYGNLVFVSFEVGIDGRGLITTRYKIEKLGAAMPRTVKIRIGMDCGGLDEIGVYYLLDASVDTLSWKRKGLWTTYPADHIGRGSGVAVRKAAVEESAIGEAPNTSWSSDTRDYALYGKYDLGFRGTNDFRSMKSRVLAAAAYNAMREGAVQVESDGSESIRLEVVPAIQAIVDDRDLSIRYVGTWYAMDDPSGSLYNTEMFSETAGDYAELEFHGTGIQWFGPADMIGGIARVYVDGELMDNDISQYSDEVEKYGMSRGYEKRYQKLLYSADHLPEGNHTLRIEVTGLKRAQADYAFVMIDWFKVLGIEDDPVKLVMNNDFNYTRLAWGNYVRPDIQVGDGYQNRVCMRLVARPDTCERRNG